MGNNEPEDVIRITSTVKNTDKIFIHLKLKRNKSFLSNIL